MPGAFLDRGLEPPDQITHIIGVELGVQVNTPLVGSIVALVPAPVPRLGPICARRSRYGFSSNVAMLPCRSKVKIPIPVASSALTGTARSVAPLLWAERWQVRPRSSSHFIMGVRLERTELMYH